jgi:hypothetical protein
LKIDDARFGYVNLCVLERDTFSYTIVLKQKGPVAPCGNFAENKSEN